MTKKNNLKSKLKTSKIINLILLVLLLGAGGFFVSNYEKELKRIDNYTLQKRELEEAKNRIKELEAERFTPVSNLQPKIVEEFKNSNDFKDLFSSYFNDFLQQKYTSDFVNSDFGLDFEKEIEPIFREFEQKYNKKEETK